MSKILKIIKNPIHYFFLQGGKTHPVLHLEVGNLSLAHKTSLSCAYSLRITIKEMD